MQAHSQKQNIQSEQINKPGELNDTQAPLNPWGTVAVSQVSRLYFVIFAACTLRR